MDAQDITNRFTYHPPKDGYQITRYQVIRGRGLDLAMLFDSWCPDSRELSLAITHLEEAVMWANAAIAGNEQ